MEKPILFPKPELQYLMSLEYEVRETIDLGNRKQIQTIFDGTVKGTINGSVREGSGNWLETDVEGNVWLDGKYTIETEDKLIVPLDVNGILTQDGKMKLRVFFHCGHKEYRHLNRNVVIAVGMVTGDIYRMDLYMLVDKAAQSNHNAFFEKPALEHLYYIHVKVGPILMAGSRPEGRHMVIPIQSGRFEGERIQGNVANAGADWNDMIVGVPMLSHVSTRYLLKTDDGAYISLFTDGHMNMGIPGMLAMLKKQPDPLKTYFKQHLKFSTGDQRYSWLNGEICVAIISPTPEQNICYDAYQVRI